MSFKGRPIGLTTRRAREAMYNPEQGGERFHADFPTVLACPDCGKFTMAPRHLLSEAMAEHRRTYCSARKTKIDEPHMQHVLFPRI